MNSAELWAGEHYAWIPGRGRGETRFIRSVKRVKVLSLRKVYRHGNERRTTVVSVEVLDWDGNSLAEQHFEQIDAREIVETWDEYRGMHESSFDNFIESERRQAQEAQKKAERRARVLAAVHLAQLPGKLDSFGSNFTIRIDDLEVWLHERGHLDGSEHRSQPSVEVP